MKLLLLTYFIIILIAFSTQCELNGKIEGQCLSLADVKSKINFCASKLHDYTCVPFYNVIN